MKSLQSYSRYFFTLSNLCARNSLSFPTTINSLLKRYLISTTIIIIQSEICKYDGELNSFHWDNVDVIVCGINFRRFWRVNASELVIKSYESS